VSREGAPAKRDKAEAAARPARAGTPIWVWLVYGLGVLAAVIFLFSVLFTLGALVLSDDVPVTYDVSVPAIVLWGGLMLVAVALWVVRRRRSR
jgi:LPXTG-motif cell wall-anchored protein